MRKKFFLDTLISVALGLALGVILLAISNKNAQPLDVTKNGRFTFSEQSRKAVQNLATKVKVLAFVDEKSGKKKAEEMLTRYRRVDPSKIDFELIDPYKRPRTAQVYDIRQAGSLVLETYPKGSKTPRRERVSAITEQEITNALMRMSRQQESKIYVLTGHDEKPLDGKDQDSLSNFKADLSREGLTLESLNLAKDKIPAEAKVVMIAGPRGNLLPGEDKQLRDFLSRNGSLFLMLDPDSPASFAKIAEDYGIDSPPDVIIDEASQLLNAEPIFALAMSYDNNHPITKDFKQNAVFRLARPVNPGKATPPNSKVSWLAQTAPTAFTLPADENLGKSIKIDPAKVKHDVINLATVGSYPKGPQPAPTPGVEAPKIPETRMVVVGDSDFVSNALFRQAPGNRDFALNILNWLAQSENQISIRPTDPETTPLRMNQKDLSNLFLLNVLMLPLLVAGLGSYLTYRRR